MNTETLLDPRLPNALKLAAAREVNAPAVQAILLGLANNITVFLRTEMGLAEVISLMAEYIGFCMSQEKCPGAVTDLRRDCTTYFARILGDMVIGGTEKIGRGFVVAMHSSFRAELDSAKVQAEMDRLGVKPGTY